MLNPKPSYYDKILLFRGTGKAKIGGIAQRPNLSLSYLLAARHVIESAQPHLSEVALPTAYLQRHAVEIELKDILSTARSIAQDDAWFELLRTNEQAEPPAVNPVPPDHNLLRLLKDAQEAVNAIGLNPLPMALAVMSTTLTTLEKSDPTRMRYLRSRKGDNQFPSSEVLPIVEHQNELEALFADLVFVAGKPDDPNQNYGTRLAWACEFAAQPLHYRLNDLGRL
jgi:hypothetical protein